MKKTLSFLAITLVTCSIISGCSKGGSTSSPTGTMSASIGGTAFTATSCFESSTGSGSSYTSLTGENSTTTIEFTILDNGSTIPSGSYSLDSTGLKNSGGYTTTSGVYKKAKSGTLTITSWNPGVKVTGTFSFTCTDGTVVSNGNFTAVF